jgi:ribose transport system substrate-binding protein
MADPREGGGMNTPARGRRRSDTRWRIACLAATASLAVVAGCSSSSSSSAPAPSGTTSSSGTASSASAASSASSGAASSDAVATAATQALQQWIKGSQTAPPTTGPKAQKGKSIWVLSCGQAAAACAYWANSVVQAGKAIGWKVTLYDDKLVPANGNTGLEDAVAAHADGAIVLGNSCPQNEQGLKAAQAAHMPVVGIDEDDCNDPLFGGSGPQLLTGLKYTAAYPTVDSFLESNGTLQADYLLAHLGSSANVIEFKSTDIVSKELVNQGFEAEYKKLCPSCKLTQVPYSLNDMIGGQLKTKAQDALESDSAANGIEVTADSDIGLVIGPIVDSSANASKILLVGAEGLSSNITAARAGQWESAGSGEPFNWEAWAAVDALNRIFAGSPQVYSGIGLQLWSVKPTQVNLPPAGQNYDPPGVNFEQDYEKLWGVG